MKRKRKFSNKFKEKYMNRGKRKERGVCMGGGIGIK